MTGPGLHTLDRPELEALQLGRLRRLLGQVVPHNLFYRDRLAAACLDARSLHTWADFRRLAPVSKAELLKDQHEHPPWGRVLTYPRQRYCRFHQTSGTAGRPLVWLDTRESWQWMLGNWEQIFAITGVTAADRLFFPFSFGPFLGFWTAFESATRAGMFVLAAGGMSSGARLRCLLEHDISVVLCTPTYALHLAEVAQAEGIDLASSNVRAIIVAGEPGGSIPATRARIEAGWGARLYDHAGMTEVGPVSVECQANPGGLHILESEFVAEVVDLNTLEPVPAGTTGELILTNLGRTGSPLLRYRTGDLVCVDPEPCPCGRSLMRLRGGILGRADDMIHLRGNNVHPSTLEAILRRFDEVAEYCIEVDRSAALPVLRILVEPTEAGVGPALTERIDRAIRDELLFRAEVRPVAPGSLPRYEMKARRVVHRTTRKDEG